MRDYKALPTVASFVEKLVAEKDAFKIMLAVRLNRLLLKEILRSHELLACLCSDPNHQEYLQLLKCWYFYDDVIVSTISLLLNRIELIKTTLDQGVIINYFNKNIENNTLCMFSALHVLLLKDSHDLSYLIKASSVLKIFEEKGWLISLAMAFEEVAFWILDSGYITTLKITPDQLCDLLKAQPKLWAKFQDKKENIREMPNRLLYSQHLHALLLNNGSRQSLEAATLAVSWSSNLFSRLCSLRESHPNELLRFFSKYIKLFRQNYGVSYNECEKKLLIFCDADSVQRYLECLYGGLGNKEFSDVFSAVVLMGDYQIDSEEKHQISKKVLISLLVKRIKRKPADMDSIWDSLSKLEAMAGLLRHEPRLAYLMKLSSFGDFLLGYPIRGVVRAFVDCVVSQHPNLCGIALRVLNRNELRAVILSRNNRLSIIRFLITEPCAVELMMPALSVNCALEMEPLFQHASTQQLILLLIAFTVRENELRSKLESYQKLSALYTDKTIQEFLQLTGPLNDELRHIVNIKKSILDSRRASAAFDKT